MDLAELEAFFTARLAQPLPGAEAQSAVKSQSGTEPQPGVRTLRGATRQEQAGAKQEVRAKVGAELRVKVKAVEEMQPELQV